MDADFGNKDDIIRQKDFYWMLWKRMYICICSQKLEYAELYPYLERTIYQYQAARKRQRKYEVWKPLSKRGMYDFLRRGK